MNYFAYGLIIGWSLQSLVAVWIIGKSERNGRDLARKEMAWMKKSESEDVLRLPELPALHDSHSWGPYGHYGEARCEACKCWTDEYKRSLPCIPILNER